MYTETSSQLLAYIMHISRSRPFVCVRADAGRGAKGVFRDRKSRSLLLLLLVVV